MSDFTFRDPLTGIIRFNDANVIHIGYEPSSEDITITAQNDETGTSKTITANMSGGGGSAVLGQKTITVNGTYDASDDGLDGYDQVTVNVPASGYTLQELATGLEPSGTINITGLNVATGAFSFKPMTRVIGSGVTLNAYCFQNSALETVNLKSSHTNGNDVFRNCASLQIAVIELLDTITGSGLFHTCQNLETVDFTGSSMKNNYFYAANKLDVIVLRSSDIVAMENTGVLGNTAHYKSGGTGGTIYIPKSLYDHLGDGTAYDYKAATNWSVVDAYGTITWQPIEGSYYETHYADGTEV